MNPTCSQLRCSHSGYLNVIHEEMTKDNVPEQIIDSIASPELKDIAIEFAELSIDQLFEDGPIKDVPIIGTLIKLLKGAKDIRDKIFIVKVAKFLCGMSKTSLEQRTSFQQKINEDKKIKRKVGESLVVILDRLDDFEKPELIAKCFSAYLGKKISYSEFRRLAIAIDIAFINDLKILLGQMVEQDRYTENYLTNLSRTGLVDFNERKTWKELGQTQFKISSLGQLFINIINDSLGVVETNVM